MRVTSGALLYDCMIGDATLFQRADMVEAGWRVIQPVLDVWSAVPAERFPNYAAGSWGPAEADELLTRGRISTIQHEMVWWQVYDQMSPTMHPSGKGA